MYSSYIHSIVTCGTILGGNSTSTAKIFRIKKKLEQQKIKGVGIPAEIYLD